MQKPLLLLLPVFVSLVIAMAAVSAIGAESSAPDDPLAWPAMTRDTRPWTRWWWMGSAVDKENLARELTRYHEAGLGGVEITPIYGVKGREAQFIDYLSPKWMEMLAHSVKTADGLNMGVDMANGTGWCFGGPNVSDADANAVAVPRTFEVKAGEKLAEKFDKAATQALTAYPATEGGKCSELTDKIAADGTTDWTAPAEGAPWTVYAVSQKPSGVKVKRPAPGGAGPMLNLLYGSAMDRYLKRFAEAFDAAGKDFPKPSALFHDSYEYNSNWAPDFLAQFEKRRGYRLQTELPALFGREQGNNSDHVARVKSDYRETASDIQAEESIPAWTKWAHERKMLTREQAHGSPGNWLDIYAAADIPETEMFNKDRDVLVSKFASSAAHTSGKNLVGSESGTWVAEHFTERLSDVKGVVDDLFLSGVNRVTYHGSAYSPDDAAWPGWCFYASTEMNPRNALWHDAPALNAYVARVQSVMQAGKSDNDVLLYWPVYDRWHDARGLLQQFTVHGRDWFHDQPIGAAAEFLHKDGFLFDYASDRQLADLSNRTDAAHPNPYRMIVIPKCEHMPPATLKSLLDLAAKGATVIFEDHLPNNVPGAGRLEERRVELKNASGPVASMGQPSADKAAEMKLGKGGVRIGSLASVIKEDALCEPMVYETDLRVVRRLHGGDRYLLIINTGDKRFERWAPLHQTPIKAAAIMNPMTGQVKLAKFRLFKGGGSGTAESIMPQVYLQLDPHQSVILRTFENNNESSEAKLVNGPAWNYYQPDGQPVELKGAWNVKFVQGGPSLPKPFQTDKLVSWTQLGGEEAQTFAGSALYTLDFDAPAQTAAHWALDLGAVCQSARVKLNGKDLGTIFTTPYRVPVEGLKPQGNTLEVEVTGTSANRIRDLDVRKVPWKIFYDTNIVTMGYKPFDASGWPIADQGLLGPVTLQPEKAAAAQ